MASYIRGEPIKFTATFTDPDNPSTAATGATLRVTYINASNATETETIAMSLVGSEWVATWDSSVARTGKVYWHAKSTAPFISIEEGEFDLIANRANPAPSEGTP